MSKPVTRHMMEALRQIADSSRFDWVPWWFFRSADSLKSRGLVEVEWRDYQPPPRRTPHVRLTAEGRALLGRNQPEDEDP